MGAQVFEQLPVQPLQDAVSNIVQHKTALLELAAKADSLAQQIAMTIEGAGGSVSKMSTSSKSAGGIKISNANEVLNAFENM